jgi:hypothetical protein
LPDADQVADRWQLIENSSRAFLDAVGKSMRQIRQAMPLECIEQMLSFRGGRSAGRSHAQRPDLFDLESSNLGLRICSLR